MVQDLRSFRNQSNCFGIGWAQQMALIAALLLGWAHPLLASGTITNCAEADLQLALLGGGFVTIACDTPIPISSTLIVNREVVLDGTGHTGGISGGASTNLGRLFMVQPGGHLTLRSLVITGGFLAGANGTNGASGQDALGAAIYNDHGVVTLESCTFSNHQATGGLGADGFGNRGKGGTGGAGAGAALYNNGGQVTITNTVFTGNTASGGTGGKGTAGSSSGNGSQGGAGGDGGSGLGAAICNSDNGMLSIYSSMFSSNQVTGSSAGTGGVGGGILGFPGPSGNSGSAVGGAVCNQSGTVVIVNSTFISNSGAGATGTLGAAGTGTTDGGNGTSGGPALGGGVFNAAGPLTLTNCTFVLNSLVGGTGGIGGVAGTFGLAANGGDGGNGGEALGGGVYGSSASNTILVNCTFSVNELTGGKPGIGGAGSGVGGSGDSGSVGDTVGTALFNAGGTMQLRNSILAQATVGPNAGGPISDAGFNLSSDATPAFTAQGSRNRIDPLLDAYSTAGGLVPTLTLSSNSPAINAITVPGGNGCPTFDQRNALRVAPCDIGAFEFGGTFNPPVLQAQLQTNQVVLSWPASGNFVLQTTPALTGTNVWTTAVDQPQASSGTNKVTVVSTNQAQFYRLATPSP